MIKCQNSIVTVIAECSKCLPPAPSSNTSYLINLGTARYSRPKVYVDLL